MTDLYRAALGLPPKESSPTPGGGAPPIGTIAPPLVELDWSNRQMVTIHAGPNPQDENANVKPPGVLGMRIWFHSGGIPTNDADWVRLGVDTESPFEHSLNNPAPVLVAYCAQYVDKKIKYGPKGPAVTCTVSA